MDNQPPIIEHSSPPSLLGYRIPDPSVSQNAAINTQIGQIEGTKSVDVTVIRANDLPRLKNVIGKKRQFFVTVTSGATTKKTAAVRSVAQAVRWDEMLGTLWVSYPHSYRYTD
jgi:hypothetical protein